MEELACEHFDRFNSLVNSLDWEYGENKAELACRLCEIADCVSSKTDPIEKEYLYLRAIELFEAANGPLYPLVFVSINGYADQLRQSYLQSQAAMRLTSRKKGNAARARRRRAA